MRVYDTKPFIIFLFNARCHSKNFLFWHDENLWQSPRESRESQHCILKLHHSRRITKNNTSTLLERVLVVIILSFLAVKLAKSVFVLHRIYLHSPVLVHTTKQHPKGRPKPKERLYLYQTWSSGVPHGKKRNSITTCSGGAARVGRGLKGHLFLRFALYYSCSPLASAPVPWLNLTRSRPNRSIRGTGLNERETGRSHAVPVEYGTTLGTTATCFYSLIDSYIGSLPQTKREYNRELFALANRRKTCFWYWWWFIHCYGTVGEISL